MKFRTDLEILALDPQVGGMTIIEARAADGSTAVLMVRVAEPLAVGGHMTLALTAEPAAAPQTSGPSMRDRLQARLGGAVATNAGPAPRLAITLNSPVSAGTPNSQAGTHPPSNPPSNPPAASAASAPAPQTSSTADASSLLLSSILGASPRGSASQERNVDDEMDALFGARRKG